MPIVYCIYMSLLTDFPTSLLSSLGSLIWIPSLIPLQLSLIQLTDPVDPHLHAYPPSTYITDLGVPFTFTFSKYTIFSYFSFLLPLLIPSLFSHAEGGNIFRERGG